MKISITLLALSFAIAASTFNPKPQQPAQQFDAVGIQVVHQDTISAQIDSVQSEIRRGLLKARKNAIKNTIEVKKIYSRRDKERQCCIFLDSSGTKKINH